MMLKLKCVLCNREYGLHETQTVCLDCGQVGTLDVVIEHNQPPQKRDQTHGFNMWTQRDLLPIEGEPLAGLQAIGGTPLISYDALTDLAESLDIKGLCLKNDGLSLTGSLKDRASAMVVQIALSMLDRKVIATASTGNAAAALAGCCAAVPEAEAIIFVPETAPQGKIAQMLLFGATVFQVQGDYDTAFDLCWQASEAFGWYNRSTGINPFTSEGKKTVAFEFAQQLDWHMPDVIMVSVGDGSIISGVYKGCQELVDLGWVDKMPRIIGVQASGSDALIYAWENNISAQDMEARSADTIADSISSRLPRDRAKALRAVNKSNGAFVRVSDEDILAAMPQLAMHTGVFAEPAATAAFAGIMPAQKQGYISKNDHVLVLITGNGLKDVNAALKSVSHLQQRSIAPTLAAVQHSLENGK